MIIVMFTIKLIGKKSLLIVNYRGLKIEIKAKKQQGLSPCCFFAFIIRLQRMEVKPFGVNV